MNTVQHFFRKYFISSISILVLFLAVNIILSMIVLIVSYA